MFIVPGIFLIIFIAVVALCLYIISPFAAAFTGNAIDLITRWLLEISKYFASFTALRIVDFFPKIVYILIAVLAIICLLEWRKIRVRFIFACTIFVLLGWHVWHDIHLSPGRRIQITVLDVGQGDATVVSMPDGKTMLIDAGPVSNGWDAGQNVILPFLRKSGIKEIDLAVISHPHLDHFGGFIHLAQQIPIRRAIFADTAYADKNFRRLVRLLQKQETRIAIVRRGHVITDFDPVMIYVLGPHPANAKLTGHWNQASLVLKLQFGNCAFLTGGDTELPGEADLLGFGDFLVSDLLKAGHHGSKTSSGLKFLQKVQPKWVAVSAGAFNKFNHPARQIIERYSQLSIKVARTDLEGALQFATDGQRLWRKVY